MNNIVSEYLNLLDTQRESNFSLLNGLTDAQLWQRPAPKEWSIGRRLFQHALERSHVRGVAFLKIEADPNAQSFYEKMGAQKVSEHQYELDGQLRVLPIMEIDL